MSLAIQVFRVTNINFLPATSIHQNAMITNCFYLLSNSLNKSIKKNAWRKVKGICMWLLGLKGLTMLSNNNNNNIFYLYTVGFKANMVYGAM